jgi:osmotically-inducible protein OsmY
MSKRYEDRYGRGSDERQRDLAHDRGLADRATDEVRSWFGDDDAERRRRADEYRYRTQTRSNDWNERDFDARTASPYADPGYYDRSYPDRSWSADEGRAEFGRRFVGLGPKGYQRSDSRIHEDVCDRLTYADVDAENIEVSVTSCEVTLNGTVRDRWDKRRAEEIAENVPGVKDVHNHIRVLREDRGIGMSATSTSDQPGSVLGVNPTEGSHLTGSAPGNRRRS